MEGKVKGRREKGKKNGMRQEYERRGGDENKKRDDVRREGR